MDTPKYYLFLTVKEEKKPRESPGNARGICGCRSEAALISISQGTGPDSEREPCHGLWKMPTAMPFRRTEKSNVESKPEDKEMSAAEEG